MFVHPTGTIPSQLAGTHRSDGTVSVVAWEDLADRVAAERPWPGTLLRITGYLKTRRWTDPSGNRRCAHDVQVRAIENLGPAPHLT